MPASASDYCCRPMIYHSLYILTKFCVAYHESEWLLTRNNWQTEAASWFSREQTGQSMLFVSSRKYIQYPSSLDHITATVTYSSTIFHVLCKHMVYNVWQNYHYATFTSICLSVQVGGHKRLTPGQNVSFLSVWHYISWLTDTATNMLAPD